MGIAVMKCLRFADTQESCFEAWKRSYLSCAALQCGRLAYAQESRNQAAKCSKMGSAATAVCNFLMLRNRYSGCESTNMGIAIIKGLRFADSKESLFQASKLFNICSPVQVSGRFADIQEFFFKLQNIQIINVSNCKKVYFLIVRNGIFRLRNDEI